jgi:hypothetical protein
MTCDIVRQCLWLDLDRIIAQTVERSSNDQDHPPPGAKRRQRGTSEGNEPVGAGAAHCSAAVSSPRSLVELN